MLGSNRWIMIKIYLMIEYTINKKIVDIVVEYCEFNNEFCGFLDLKTNIYIILIII